MNQPLHLSTEPTSPRIDRLIRDLAVGDPQPVVDAFMAELSRNGTPLVEPIAGSDECFVTFVVRDGAISKAFLMPGPIEPACEPTGHALSRVHGTDLWIRTYRLRDDLRMSYCLVADRDAPAPDVLFGPNSQQVWNDFMQGKRHDSLNPRKFPRQPPPWAKDWCDALLELPSAPPQPWTIADPQRPAGTLEHVDFTSSRMGNTRGISIYLPPEYRRESGPYDLLIVFDEVCYLDPIIPTPTILDNLTAAGHIRPHIALLIGNPEGKRDAELSHHRDFADMITLEMLPWLQERHPITQDPARTTLAGSSAGGRYSSQMALLYPERYGKVLSQSGSYWWPDDPNIPREELTRRYQAAPRQSVRFYLDAGTLESIGPRPHLLDANRNFRDVLITKGYDVTYREFIGGHDYACWRGTLADGLIALNRG